MYLHQLFHGMAQNNSENDKIIADSRAKNYPERFR